jgi:hypothetical protein
VALVACRVRFKKKLLPPQLQVTLALANGVAVASSPPPAVASHNPDTSDGAGATTTTAHTGAAAAANACPAVTSPTPPPATAHPNGDSQRFFTAAEKLLDGVEQLLASKRRATPAAAASAAAGSKQDPQKAAARAAEMQAMQSMLQDLTNALHTGPQEDDGGGGQGKPVVSTPSLLLGQVTCVRASPRYGRVVSSISTQELMRCCYWQLGWLVRWTAYYPLGLCSVC